MEDIPSPSERPRIGGPRIRPGQLERIERESQR